MIRQLREKEKEMLLGICNRLQLGSFPEEWRTALINH
jgi:hypothetical protein